jgi:hypothetical protein
MQSQRGTPSVRVAAAMALSLAAGLALALLPFGSAARAQQCATTGTNQTCTNSIFLSGGTIGILDTATLTVTNTGTIFGSAGIGGGFGIAANTAAIVTNYGTISGAGTEFGSFGVGINAPAVTVTNYGTIAGTGDFQGNGINALTAIVTNYGTIFGSAGGVGFGISAITAAIVTNYGTISGSGGAAGAGFGIRATTATVTNFGIISGTGIQGFGIQALGTGNVTNAGTIFGNMAAITFAGNPDTLTLLPGSTIIGAINLGGGGDTVNFRGGNHNLTFDTLAGATVTGTTPFVVVGNRAVAFDATGFAMADRTLNDIAGGISGMIASRFGPFAGGPPGGGMVASYAPVYKAPVAGGVAWPVKAEPGVPYNPATVVWAQGFGGRRDQPEDLPVLASRHNFAGAAIGFDRMVSPDLRLGAFAGGAWGKLDTDFTVQNVESSYVFGGLYGRYDWRRSFLDFAVSLGRSRNDSERHINNNLVPNGIEIAKASYNGWFVSPEASYGWRLPLAGFALAPGLARTAAVVPSAKVRYLAAWYDGYTETGSSANLTVNARSLQTFEGRLQLALTASTALPWGSVLRAAVHGGAIGYARVGDKGVSALLLGQGLAFAVPGKDQASGWYYGGRFEAGVGPFARLFAEAESIALSDHSRITTARGGLEVAF